jgi:hypothetical protein
MLKELQQRRQSIKVGVEAMFNEPYYSSQQAAFERTSR